MLNIKRQAVADYLVILTPLAVAAGIPITYAAKQGEMIAFAVVALLYFRPLLWSVRYVRKSGLLLTSDKAIGSLLALLASPALLPVVLARDCARSRWLFGLALIYCEIIGALLWLSPTGTMLMVLPLLTWISGGLLRLYAVLAKPNEKRLLKLARAVVGWPVVLVGFTIKYVGMGLLNLLRAWPLIFLGALVAEVGWNNWLAGALVIAGLFSLPLLLGTACSVCWPSGFDGLQLGGFGSGGMSDFTPSFGGGHLGGNYGFDAPMINPANGLPMVGGIGGMDIHGNSYGSNYHDQF